MDAQGPPGTGKTRTLLSLLQVLSKMVKVDTGGEAVGAILACADTNAATDNMLGGLQEKGVRVVRLGRPTSVRHSFRLTLLPSMPSQEKPHKTDYVPARVNLETLIAWMLLSKQENVSDSLEAMLSDGLSWLV